MSDLLSIGSSGVAAYQRALTTVSNNISNVGTEGYVRQETALAENMPRKQGRMYLGTGASVVAVRRAYDQFLEQNLRNTTSELNTQGPMVNYANRLVDIMGSESIGLPSALDQFFASARALSAEPSSTIQRQQFLRDADGLAGRFRELSTQLTGVDTETREAIQAKLDSINTLAGQLAGVNKQLFRQSILDRQPPDLLDQRDLILTKLSEIVKTTVTMRSNGVVDVSIGSVANAGSLVSADRAVPLAVKFDDADLSKVVIVADPYSKTPDEVIGISSGELGGLMAFREQVLQPTTEALDFLASAVATEINAVHTNGMDAFGDLGKPLFAIDQIKYADPVSGEIKIFDRAAAGIRVAIDDASRVAAASLFRVIENENNLSGVDAILSYAPSFTDTAKPLSSILKNNPHPSAGIVPKAGAVLGQIPVGASDWSLYLDNATGKQNLQVFTRDGRQLMGTSVPTIEEQEALLQPENGFYAGTTYSNAYLNKSGEYAYKQMSLFYGAQANPGLQFSDSASFTPNHTALPSYLYQDPVAGKAIPPSLEAIPSGSLTINGKQLPALIPREPGASLQASDFVRWITDSTLGMDPPVVASGVTEAALEIADPSKGLYINGYAVPADDARTTVTEIRDYINVNMVATAKVIAAVDENGNLVLSNAPGFDGNDINIQAMRPNGEAVDETTTYKGQLTLVSTADITIGYGPNATRDALEVLGRPLGKYYIELPPIRSTDARLSSLAMARELYEVPGGTLTLNGKPLEQLKKLDIDENPIELQASDIAVWLNKVGDTLEPPILVTAATSLKSLNPIFDGLAGLTINGIEIAGPYTNERQLIDAINNNSALARTGVSAAIDSSGKIIVENYTGKDITIGGSGVSAVNALGIANGKYKGSISLISESQVRMGFQGDGLPSALANLGLRTGVHIDGPVQEDLLVVMSGEGSATVSGSYDATMADPANLDTVRINTLRKQDFEVLFDTPSHYQITWTNPTSGVKTIVAERRYDPTVGIEYQGLRLMIGNPPAAGDRFLLDGNQDGIGNNENINEIVALERSGIIGKPYGMTIAQSYENTVGKIGNVASQASIAEKALKVVNDQAIEARDKISGVSLDSEAADLIRFQQAYQASAKSMQVAQQLFDSILQAAG
jgi:flagellar hook-associated protein FlgK